MIDIFVLIFDVELCLSGWVFLFCCCVIIGSEKLFEENLVLVCGVLLCGCVEIDLGCVVFGCLGCIVLYVLKEWE